MAWIEQSVTGLRPVAILFQGRGRADRAFRVIVASFTGMP